MRRLVALLTTLSVLHLILVGGTLACASHGAAGDDTMPSMAVTHPAHHDADCARPTDGHCCDAMSSCGVTTTVSARVQFLAPATPATATPSYVASVSLSVSTSPDPPPPKA